MGVGKMERERNRKGKPWEKERDTGKEGKEPYVPMTCQSSDFSA